MKEVAILDMENNYRKRAISEMVHIQHDKNTCNYKKDTEKIGNCYFNLIEMMKPGELKIKLEASL